MTTAYRFVLSLVVTVALWLLGMVPSIPLTLTVAVIMVLGAGCAIMALPPAIKADGPETAGGNEHYQRPLRRGAEIYHHSGENDVLQRLGAEDATARRPSRANRELPLPTFSPKGI